MLVYVLAIYQGGLSHEQRAVEPSINDALGKEAYMNSGNLHISSWAET